MQDGTPIIIKKKKAHAHAHHGGAWKVAYADFVTAMMAFFMVMWIMGMDQPTREVIAGYFKDPVGFQKNVPKSKVNLLNNTGALMTQPGKAGPDNGRKNELTMMRRVEENVRKAVDADPGLKQLIAKKGLEVKMTPEGLEIELIENETNSELFFKLGSSEVRPNAKAVLARLAPVLGATQRKMVVDGHTDARPLTKPDYDNFDLSHDRANAVRRLLVRDGCAPGQFLAVRGYAANQLRNDKDPNHFSNRRVSILLPYAFKESSIEGLPADLNRESIEGVFRMPQVGPDDPGIKP